MPIITLTSDFGDSSYYVAVVKGVLLTECPSCQIIDISHSIADYDLMEAAFVLKSAARAFPKSSIHLVAVDPDTVKPIRGVVVKFRDQLFVGADNGILSLVSDGSEVECYSIDNPALQNADFPDSFIAAKLFAPTASFLARGGEISQVGQASTLRELHWGDPTYSENSLRGKILYIDKFGNAITNISKNHFMEIRQGRPFEIIVRNLRLKRIVNTYSDVNKADALAIFGEGQLLEISMREAAAASMLGLNVHDMITIEFTPAQTA